MPGYIEQIMDFKQNKKWNIVPAYIYVLLLGTGLLSVREHLGHSSHGEPVRIGNCTHTFNSGSAGFLARFSKESEDVSSDNFFYVSIIIIIVILVTKVCKTFLYVYFTFYVPIKNIINLFFFWYLHSLTHFIRSLFFNHSSWSCVQSFASTLVWTYVVRKIKSNNILYGDNIFV